MAGRSPVESLRVAALGAVLALALPGCPGSAEDVAPPAKPGAVEAAPRVRTGTAPSPPAPAPAAPVGPDGGWQPPEEHLRLARELADPARREAILELLEGMPANERIDVFRAGLRLGDPDAAAVSANSLEWAQLDGWEAARAVELLVPRMFDADLDVDFDELRSYLGSSELAPVLELAARHPEAALNWNVSGQLHRQARAGHVPLYVRLATSDSPRLAAAAFAELGNILRFTDQHREDVARLLAARYPQAAQGAPPAAGAISTELAQSVRAVLRAPSEDQLLKRGYFAWVARWLAEVRPSAGDTALLLDLVRILEQEDLAATGALPTVLARALGFLDDPASLAALRAWVGTDEDDQRVAQAALARRGDERAAKALWADFAEDELAMALALDLDTRQGARRLAARLSRSDLEATADVLRAFGEADWWRRRYGFDWDDEAFAAVEQAVTSAGLGAAQLGTVARHVPACRTQRMVAAILTALRGPGGLTSFFDAWADGEGALKRDTVVHTLALLEVSAPEAFRALLLTESGDSDATERERALQLLLELGDDASGARLAEWVDASPDGLGRLWNGDEGTLIALARSRHWAVRKLLAERTISEVYAARSQAWTALGIFHGLPETLAADLSGALDERTQAAVYDHLLSGRPSDAVAAVTAARPDTQVDDVGAVRDPRVRSYLERLRRRRDLGHYLWATGELALMGDEGARAEVRAAIRAGRYRWVDNWRAEVLTLGDDVAMLPFWIDEAESNCCRLVVANTVFEQRFGTDYYRIRPGEAGEGATPAAVMREWFRESGGRFAWSWFARAYVPVAR